jgi:hypothetical protein
MPFGRPQSQVNRSCVGASQCRRLASQQTRCSAFPESLIALLAATERRLLLRQPQQQRPKLDKLRTRHPHAQRPPVTGLKADSESVVRRIVRRPNVNPDNLSLAVVAEKADFLLIPR